MHLVQQPGATGQLALAAALGQRGRVEQFEIDRRIARRPIRPDDRLFLLALHAGTREQELAAVGEDDQKAAFVRMQFDASTRTTRSTTRARGG